MTTVHCIVASSAKELQSSQTLGFYRYGVGRCGRMPYVAFHQAADIIDCVSQNRVNCLTSPSHKSANVNGALLIFCRLAKNT